MNWEAFLAGLSGTEARQAQELAARYGREAGDRHVRYNPVGSLAELEAALNKNHRRVRTQVPGLYESINVRRPPAGWGVANVRQMEPDGTIVIQTDVTGPNGASGFFERGYNPASGRIELRNAFLQFGGMTEELPVWVEGGGVPMVPARGTPTVQYFTLYQFKLMRVPAGRVRWWRPLFYRWGLRAGPFTAPGVVASIKMSTIQNLETILHLHWLRGRYPAADLSDLIVHTASVQYAETTAVLCGYRLNGARYMTAGEWENEIGFLMDHFESGTPQRAAAHDGLLRRYSFTRATVMKQNFDIELRVIPC